MSKLYLKHFFTTSNLIEAACTLASADTRHNVMVSISHAMYLIYHERETECMWKEGRGRYHALAWRQWDTDGNTIMHSRVFQQAIVR